MKSVKEKAQSAYEVMKGQFGYKNTMASPKLVKVVVSAGTGSGMKRDVKRNEHVINRITKITVQKPALKGAKQSMASFKIRQGDQ